MSYGQDGPWRLISDLAGLTPDGGAVLIFNPGLAADDSFPGHATSVSNSAYLLAGNAEKHGASHWRHFSACPNGFQKAVKP